MQSKPESVDGVSSAERALAVLTAFTRNDVSLSLVQLAERTGLVKSTIMRLAVSLEMFGLLARLTDGQYRLDAECLRLGSAYQSAFNLSDRVMPVLEKLAADTGETASFYVPHGSERLCLFRVESLHRLRTHVQPGDLRPMDKAASAQVLRRFKNTRFDGRLDDDLPLFTSGITDPHVASLAVPVFGAESKLIGALTISGPVTRLSESVAKTKGKLLWTAGIALTRACGGHILEINASALGKRASKPLR
jgi:DNA-binding IclR family transcriptional regulator